MQSLDPTTLNPVNNPRLVFTSQSELVSDVIELCEDGSFNQDFDVSHMMTLTMPGLFNCQDPGGFRQIPVKDYMVKGTKIFFFSFVNINPQAYQAMCQAVDSKLARPWWQKSYDWLQIVGQAVGLKWLHFPGTDDCSEEGVREMKAMGPYLPNSDNALIQSINNQSNPQDVLNLCLKNTDTFSFDGLWSCRRDAIDI